MTLNMAARKVLNSIMFFQAGRPITCVRPEYRRTNILGEGGSWFDTSTNDSFRPLLNRTPENFRESPVEVERQPALNAIDPNASPDDRSSRGGLWFALLTSIPAPRCYFTAPS